MFTRNEPLASQRRFWTWFAAESQGLTNTLEALIRGETDAEWAVNQLNDRIRRVDASLEADMVMTLDGLCHLTISGKEAAVHALLDAAPSLRGWRVSPGAELTDRRRVPFRLAPRPSLDLLVQPLSALHEAYA